MTRWIAALLLIGIADAASAETPGRSLCQQNADSQALLIGNAKYRHTKEAPFAVNDMTAIKRFLLQRLCYRENNIKELPNATLNDMREWLGDEQSLESGLRKSLNQKSANVFVYFSGHGVPDRFRKKAYLLPVDIDPRTDRKGYSLDLVILKLLALKDYIGPDRTVTLITDTGFSGRTPSGAILEDREPFSLILPMPDQIAWFSATTKTQTAQWDSKSKLSLFTSIFLKAVDGNADQSRDFGDNDGIVISTELTAYLARFVAETAKREFGVDQRPRLPNSALIKWRFENQINKRPGGPADDKTTRSSEEIAFWEQIKDSKNASLFESYISRFPNGIYVATARARLSDLKSNGEIQQGAGQKGRLARKTPEDNPPPATSGPDSDESILLAGATLSGGRKVSKKCRACHEFHRSKNKVGPHLVGIVGRPIASVEGYRYSRAMLALGQGSSWSLKELDLFLTRPRDHVPRTKMAFPGLKKKGDRANMLLFLKSLSEQ